VNVTLPKELEDFVAQKAASGEFPSADAVVAAGLRELQGKAMEGRAEPLPEPDGTCPPELKALLLEAVNGPHHPMPPDYFDQLRRRG
jgi:putative addiction module CopG family antidote